MSVAFHEAQKLLTEELDQHSLGFADSINR